MRIVAQVADATQDVLTEIADIIGRQAGFIQGQRKPSGSSYPQTLVSGWLIPFLISNTSLQPGQE